MSAKRIIDTVFWEDGYIMDNLTSDEKYFLLYLMSNPKSTQLGIYALPKRVIAFETGFDEQVVDQLLERFARVHRHIVYDHTSQELTILDSLKHTILKGGKPVLDCLKRELNRVKQPNLVLATYNHMKVYWERSDRPFDATVMSLFETYLIQCGLIKTKSKSNNDNDSNNNSKNKESGSDVVTDSSNDSSNDSLTHIQTSLAKFQKQAENQSTLAFRFYKEHFGELSNEDEECLHDWLDYFEDEIVKDALRRSVGKEDPMTYANKILNIWRDKGLTTLGAIFKNDRQYDANNFAVKQRVSKFKEIVPEWAK